jgi:hypothetical protein
MYSLTGINLETGQPQAASDEFWKGVVAQLRLTPRQARGLGFGLMGWGSGVEVVGVHIQVEGKRSVHLMLTQSQTPTTAHHNQQIQDTQAVLELYSYQVSRLV